MPLYLLTAQYTERSLRALATVPQPRNLDTQRVLEAGGCDLVQFWFALSSKVQIVAVIEAPDSESLAAIALAVGASGAIRDINISRLVDVETGLSVMRRAGALLENYTTPEAQAEEEGAAA